MNSFFDISLPTTNRQQREDEESLFPQLSFKERLMGFCVCCFLGYFIQLLSFGAMLGLVTGNPTKLALSYSFGNILALIGTCFLIGVKKQFENMKDKDRRVSAIIFLVSLIMIFVSAFTFKSKLLVLIFLIIQFCAYTWYAASYIPFARDCIKNCLKGITNKFIK